MAARTVTTAALVLAAIAFVACEKKAAAPSTEGPTLDRTCANDQDCVPAPDCCPAPCTADVINRASLPEAQAWRAKTCPSDPQCPSAGSCRTHAYLCVKNTCKLVYSDSPDFRPRASD